MKSTAELPKRAQLSKRLILAGRILLVLGCGAVAAAFLWDLLRGRPLAFEGEQWLLLFFGLMAMLAGTGVNIPAVQRFLHALHEQAPDLAIEKNRARVLLLAVWFGMLTALGEICIAIARANWWAHPDIPLTKDFVWMTPLADVLLFTLVGLVLFLLAWGWPKLISLRTTVFIYSFLGALSWLITFGNLHWIAQYLLALGLAVQAARIASAHPHHFATLLRLTTGWTRHLRLPKRSPDFLPGALQCYAGVLLVLGVIAVGMNVQKHRHEKQALAALPAARAGAPNVLLLVLDTVRAKSVSLDGYERATTPNLERWAHQSVSFDLAMSTAPWTLVSHAGMFTGRWAYEMNAGRLTPLNDRYPTLAEFLDAQGYDTAGFVANLAYCSYKHGLARGFIHYEDYPMSLGQVVLSSSLGRTITSSDKLRNLLGNHQMLNHKSAEVVNAQFLDWLSDRDDRPFFAFLNYFDAHEPYLPPAPFDEKFGPRRPLGKFEHVFQGARHADKESMSPDEVEALLNLYEGAIAYQDDQINRLLEELDRRGLLSNTLLIITSDHGEQFGEHDVFEHANSLYQPLMHVPLMIHFPASVPSGVTVSEPISLRDLPATVLDLTGQDDATTFPGRSLARFWSAPDTTASAGADTLYADTISDNTNMKTLFIGPYKYIWNKRPGEDREEALYRYQDDPEELHNLAADAEHQQQLESFRQALKEMLGRTTP